MPTVSSPKIFQVKISICFLKFSEDHRGQEKGCSAPTEACVYTNHHQDKASSCQVFNNSKEQKWPPKTELL